MIACWCLFLLLAIFSGAEGAMVPDGVEPSARLELQGEIFLWPAVPLKEVRALVVLAAVTRPFSAQTWSDSGGRFEFRQLAPGPYTLTVLLPRRRERHQTIEVSPSLADRQGRVRVKVVLEIPGSEGSAESRASAPSASDFKVSVAELTIPEAARKEYQRAQKELGKSRVQAALTHLEKAVTRAPQFVVALNLRGTIHHQMKEYEKAASYFRRALAQDPQAYEPLVNLGGTLISQRHFEEAVEINRRALEARPQDPLANAQLGWSYFFLDDEEKALVFLRRAKTLDANHFSYPQLGLAEIYGRRRDPVAARREWEDFLARHPDAPQAPEVRARLGSPR